MHCNMAARLQMCRTVIVSYKTRWISVLRVCVQYTHSKQRNQICFHKKHKTTVLTVIFLDLPENPRVSRATWPNTNIILMRVSLIPMYPYLLLTDLLQKMECCPVVFTRENARLVTKRWHFGLSPPLLVRSVSPWMVHSMISAILILRWVWMSGSEISQDFKVLKTCLVNFCCVFL